MINYFGFSFFFRTLSALLLVSTLTSCTTTLNKGDHVRLEPIGDNPILRVSRLFSGPDTFPPEQLSAYGIVDFPTLATEHDIERHQLICNAYTAFFPNSSDIPSTPLNEQMVTVWPLKSNSLASELNDLSLIHI